MKIIKPLRLGVLHRAFSWQKRNFLGVTILGFTDMGEKPLLRPDMELWKLTATELQTIGGVVDLAIPKTQAEFLATGYAYSNHQQDNTACAVRIQVENINKTLAVFGDRYWDNNKPSPPRTFEKMRLDWTQAYGGQGFDDNPHGIGYNKEQIDDIKYQRLPNIESLSERITSPRQKPSPASFNALDILWPRRFSRIGKQYDNRWLENEFPGFARDIDWRIFNIASPDQWWTDRDSLPPQAHWSIWNMHPEKPVQQGHLPDWQAKCFINRQRNDEILFEEILLKATTVWFFPHEEKMLLLWQGSIRINEDDAADVLHLIPAMENSTTQHPASYYQQILNQRLDKEKGALYAFRDKDLIPEELIGPWLDDTSEATPSPMVENLKSRMKIIKEQHREKLENSQQDFSELLKDAEEPELPNLNDLPEFVEKMEKKAEEEFAKLKKLQQEAEEKHPDIFNDNNKPRGPESMQNMLKMLEKKPEFYDEKKLEKFRQGIYQLYLMSAHAQPAPRPLSTEKTQAIRQQVEMIMAQGGEFHHLDFTSADLSDMDLRGAKFNKTLLEGADLSRSQLDDASFQETMLVRVKLENASLTGCHFNKTALSLAQCSHTDFSRSTFDEVNLQEIFLDHCIFDQAELNRLLFYKTYLSHCQFHQAKLDCCLFMEQLLPALDFQGAELNKVTFLKDTLESPNFSLATLTGCSWVECKIEKARFNQATLITCAAAYKTTLNEADFTLATLKQSNFRQIPLNGALFTLAKLDNSDLSEAECCGANFVQANLAGSLFIRTNFKQANLTDANLIGAIMQKSMLAGTIFDGANLYQTDLSQSFIDDKTRLTKAYNKRVKTLPRRNGELI